MRFDTRKRLSALLALLLIVSSIAIMSACNNQDGTTTTSPAGTEDTTPSSETDMDVEAELRLWVFADTHARFFEYVKEEFVNIYPNVAINIEISEYDALFDRLAVVAGAGGEGAPDMVDVEQGVFGRFIIGETIFEPLNDYLEADGKIDAISPGRQALYTWQGNIYGLEHALCPVVMAYRKDIFEQYGIEVPFTTWDDFLEAGLLLKEEGIAINNVHALPGGFRGIVDLVVRSANMDVVDLDGNVRINTEAWRSAVQMVYDWENTYEIALSYEADQDRYNQIADDRVVTIIAADWGTGFLMDFVPEQSGQWAVMQLPVLTEGDPPTSVWGGTGLTMIKTTEYKDIAWDFMSLAQLNKESAIKRFELTNLFPPLIEAFDAPELNEPNEYYGGQNLGELYAELGEIAPPQQPSWWRHLYGQAFDKYFFDFMNGAIDVNEFAESVESETEKLIEDNQ